MQSQDAYFFPLENIKKSISEFISNKVTHILQTLPFSMVLPKLGVAAINKSKEKLQLVLT